MKNGNRVRERGTRGVRVSRGQEESSVEGQREMRWIAEEENRMRKKKKNYHNEFRC